MIKTKNVYQNVVTMFFVDRDMDFTMTEYSEEDLYVTPCYSIENLYVNDTSFCQVLQTEFGLNAGDSDYDEYSNRFSKYYCDFCDIMLKFNALILLKKEKNIDVCIQDIATNNLINVDVVKGVSKTSQYDHKISEIKSKLGVNENDLVSAKTRLLMHGEKKDVFRGKNQLDFMVEFLDQLYVKKDILFTKKLKGVSIQPKQNRLSLFSAYAKTPRSLYDFLKSHNLESSLSS